MADGMHLGDEVELITDRFASIGARRGSICVIVDDWADGSNDVEYCCPDGKDVPIRFRAADDDIRAYTGTTAVKEPRKHGLIFGRGDDLGAPPGDPPALREANLEECRSEAQPVRGLGASPLSIRAVAQQRVSVRSTTDYVAPTLTAAVRPTRSPDR